MKGRALAALGIASLAGLAAAFVSQHEASTTSRAEDRIATVSTRPTAAVSAALTPASTATTTGFAFLPPSSIGGITGTARDVAVGDVNGDFRDDVVVTSNSTADAAGGVHVFLQQLDGQLAAPQRYPYPSTAMALADLNNDGTLDVVLSGRGVTLMVANGVGGFSATTFETAGILSGCDSVAVLDINRDGNADIVCVVQQAYSTIFFGDGKGGVTSKTASWGTNAVNRMDVKTGDVTGDGFADLIITTSKWRDVYVYTNNGSSSFDFGGTYELPDGGTPESVAVGDFNGDGRNDLAVSASFPSGLWILDQDTLGKLGTPRLVSASGGATDAADLDRNGLTDLFSAGTYRLQQYASGLGDAVSTGAVGFDAAAGDLNGDGCGDIATAYEGTLSVVHGTGCGIPAPVAKAPQRAADSDGDGKMDVHWYQPPTRELYRWLMDGATIRQGSGWVFTPSENATPRAHEDFNKDGLADILISDGNDIWMYVAQADGSYNRTQVAAHPPGWEILGAGDIDRDGAADLFWYHPGTRQLYFWIMDGPNVRSGRGGMAGPPNTTPVAIDDFNGDGTTDILLANSREIWMYSSTTVDTFTSKRVEVFPFGWQLGGTGDIDGDGKADLLWYHPQSRDLYYWLMDGANIRSGRTALQMPPGTAPASVGDFNADGLADVLLHNAQDIWMYQGNSLGSFTSHYVVHYPRGEGWMIY